MQKRIQNPIGYRLTFFEASLALSKIPFYY